MTGQLDPTDDHPAEFREEDGWLIDHLRALHYVPPDEALARAHAIVRHARRQQIVVATKNALMIGFRLGRKAAEPVAESAAA